MIFRSIRFLILGSVFCACSAGCNNPNQIAKVNHDYSGCFGSEQSEVFIYKKDNSIIAKLKMKGKKELEVKLSDAQLDSFNLFVKELKTLKEVGFCTSVETYKVSFQGETIKKVDGGCDWNGFSKLIHALFNLDK